MLIHTSSVISKRRLARTLNNFFCERYRKEYLTLYYQQLWKMRVFKRYKHLILFPKLVTKENELHDDLEWPKNIVSVHLYFVT